MTERLNVQYHFPVFISQSKFMFPFQYISGYFFSSSIDNAIFDSIISIIIFKLRFPQRQEHIFPRFAFFNTLIQFPQHIIFLNLYFYSFAGAITPISWHKLFLTDEYILKNLHINLALHKFKEHDILIWRLICYDSLRSFTWSIKILYDIEVLSSTLMSFDILSDAIDRIGCLDTVVSLDFINRLQSIIVKF